MERIHNSVPILMKQHGLSEDKARTLLRGMISDAEEKVRYISPPYQPTQDSVGQETADREDFKWPTYD